MQFNIIIHTNHVDVDRFFIRLPNSRSLILHTEVISSIGIEYLIRWAIGIENPPQAQIIKSTNTFVIQKGYSESNKLLFLYFLILNWNKTLQKQTIQHLKVAKDNLVFKFYLELSLKTKRKKKNTFINGSDITVIVVVGLLQELSGISDKTSQSRCCCGVRRS